MNKIYAEISAGELVDKITILKIKKEKITNKEKLVEIKKELDSLTNTFNKSIKARGTKGKCTPITKPGCTGRAKALAKTFKKMARERKSA